MADFNIADMMAAALSASQFQNWQEQFKPIELDLLAQSSLNTPSVLTNAVNDAKNTASMTADSMAGVNQRQLGDMGLKENAQQSMVSSRLRNLSRAQGIAAGANSARQNIMSQDELLAFGAAGLSK